MLIVLSHPEIVENEATIIEQLFDAGMQRFHLRKPGAGEEEMRRLLHAIPARYRSRIALHGFHELACEYGIYRLHFTEQARELAPLSEWYKKGYLLSTSVHDWQTLQELYPKFAYTFFSPVFDSLSKPGYQRVTADAFCLYDEQKKVPVVALGGIDETTIHKAMAMNFDGVAVLGAIWNDLDKSVSQFERLRDAMVLRCY